MCTIKEIQKKYYGIAALEDTLSIWEIKEYFEMAIRMWAEP